MNDAQARNAVLLGGVVSVAAITIGAAAKRQLPAPRRLLAGGVVFVALAAVADTNPRLAVPLTGLVTVSIVLANGTDALDGVTRAVTSTGRLGTGTIPQRGAPDLGDVGGPAGAGAVSAIGTPPPVAGAAGGSAATIRARIVAIALREASRGGPPTYQYAQVRPYPRSFAAPVRTDCSGLVEMVYREAGAPDPSGVGYNGSGYTGTQQQRGRRVTTPQPGDLVFYSGPDHVGIVVGGGRAVSFGSDPGPRVHAVDYRPVTQYRSYL